MVSSLIYYKVKGYVFSTLADLRSQVLLKHAAQDKIFKREIRKQLLLTQMLVLEA